MSEGVFINEYFLFCFLCQNIHNKEEFTITRYTFTVSLGKKKEKNQNERYTDLNEFKIEKKKQLIKLPTRHK